MLAEDLETLADKLYFDREPGGDGYVRFWALLLFAVIIATGGVLTDSTAVVIGAMIVAPLMTPIMASALSVVTGDVGHLRRSLLLVAGGVLLAIGTAFLIGLINPLVVTEASNSQVAARTSPRTMDLIVALASGAAGAFAVSRAKVSDALPGVAIAISLVPPLCVVGVMLANGDLSAALGALLLFVTNFLAILVAGGGMLAVMGYRRVALAGVASAYRRRASLFIGIGVILILVPLVATSVRAVRESIVEYEVRTAAATGLPPGAELLSVEVTDDELDVVMDTAGLVPLDDVEAAAQRMHDEHPDLTIYVHVLDNQLITIPAAP